MREIFLQNGTDSVVSTIHVVYSNFDVCDGVPFQAKAKQSIFLKVSLAESFYAQKRAIKSYIGVQFNLSTPTNIYRLDIYVSSFRVETDSISSHMKLSSSKSVTSYCITNST